jgi:prepilin-type N-terminal cleavage/methylation domain-containing protein
MVAMKDNRGITLVEVLIVASIIGILIVALGFSFEGWRANYYIENANKDMYADLMEAKTRALTRARVHFITIDTTQCTIQDDLDPWPDGDGALTAADNTRPVGYSDPIPLVQKTLHYRKSFPHYNLPDNYTLKMVSAGALPQTVTIHTRGGLMTPEITFRIDPGHPACCLTNTCGADDALRCRYPDYDCILISQTRIQMGKYNGTTTVCDPK